MGRGQSFLARRDFSPHTSLSRSCERIVDESPRSNHTNRETFDFLITLLEDSIVIRTIPSFLFPLKIEERGIVSCRREGGWLGKFHEFIINKKKKKEKIENGWKEGCNDDEKLNLHTRSGLEIRGTKKKRKGGGEGSGKSVDGWLAVDRTSAQEKRESSVFRFVPYGPLD